MPPSQDRWILGWLLGEQPLQITAGMLSIPSQDRRVFGGAAPPITTGHSKKGLGCSGCRWDPPGRISKPSSQGIQAWEAPHSHPFFPSHQSVAKGPRCPAGKIQKNHRNPDKKQPAANRGRSVSGPLIRPSQKAQQQVTVRGTCPSMMYFVLVLPVYLSFALCLPGRLAPSDAAGER